MSDVANFFNELPNRINKDKIAGMNATYQFDITGDNGGKWAVKLQDGTAEVTEGEVEDSNITITATDEDWMKIVKGELAGQTAFLTGKLKIKGDMSLAMKLQNLLG